MVIYNSYFILCLISLLNKIKINRQYDFFIGIGLYTINFKFNFSQKCLISVV